jgi:hypothetical protein
MLHTVFKITASLDFHFPRDEFTGVELNSAIFFVWFAAKMFLHSIGVTEKRNETILIPLSLAKKHIWPESISGWVREGNGMAWALCCGSI